MKLTKPSAISLLLLLSLINLILVFIHSYPVLSLKLQTYSLSSGQRYYSRLSLWYHYAQAGDWSSADNLEASLDPSDIFFYKVAHEPSELKKYINNLTVKSDKTIEDWLELSRIQYILGKTDSAGRSLLQAKNLDPVRDDISQMYYQLFR